jgi:hypothetical protein
MPNGEGMGYWESPLELKKEEPTDDIGEKSFSCYCDYYYIWCYYYYRFNCYYCYDWNICLDRLLLMV